MTHAPPHLFVAWLVCLAWASAPAPAHAQQGSPAPQEQAEAEPAEGDEEDEADEADEEVAEETEPEDFEEIEALDALEEQATTPRVARGGDVAPETLAPYVGLLAALQRDSGLVPELHSLPERAPSGARMLDVEEVRRRLAATKVLGEDVPLDHELVRAYMDFFDGRGKRTMASWLRRMAIYEPMITEVFRQEGLPEDLIYVAMIESGFTPRARSRASAVGLWQFIAKTARGMGLTVDRYVDERRDPVKSTRAAARYLKLLHERYDSWPLALAAYNGGPGRISGEMKRLNTNDYWALVRHGGMHGEARKYVAKVMTVGLIAKNRDLFGLNGLAVAEPMAFDLVEVHHNPSRLDVVARAADCSVDDLMKLNPELKLTSTPPVSGSYALRIPPGKAARFVEKIDGVDLSEEAERVVHVVAFGETIELIARAHGVAPRVIRAANGMGRRGRARYGESLVLPKDALGTWTPKEGKVPDEKRIVLVPADVFAREGQVARYYETSRGDSLRGIARGFGLTVGDVALWNDLDPSAKLRSGLVLQLFFDADAVPASLALTEGAAYDVVAEGSEAYEKKVRQAYRQKRARKKGRRRTHRVRKGDSLWTIAKKHKTTVEKLRRLNRKLRRNNTLQIGDKIRVR